MYGRRNNFYTQQNANGLLDPNMGAGDNNRVIRSEVWSRFRLEGLNAVCLACNEKLKVGPTRQTSSLWRHLKRHNRGPHQHYIGSIRPLPNHYSANRYNALHHHSQQQPLYGAPSQLREMVDQQQQQRHSLPKHQPNNNPQHQQVQHSSGGLLFRTFQQHIRNNNNGPLRHHGTPPPFSSSALVSSSSIASNHLHHHLPTSSSNPILLPSSSSAPLVTVDCKPVENLELDQLLGIHRDEAEVGVGGGEEQEPITLDEDEEEEDQLMESEEVEEILGGRWELARKLAEFLLENALPFHRLLVQSTTLAALLSIGQSPQKPLPPPAFLLQRVVPKLFTDTLQDRKQHFDDDFFVLMLSQIPVEGIKNVQLLKVMAQKLSDSFALCARPLGLFAFDCSTSSGLRHSFQHCFDFGPIRLHPWQISAIVHDGSADFDELCRQLDVPGIPSIQCLLRSVYAELDSLQFPPECVKRLKANFEQEAIGEMIDITCSQLSAFPVHVLPLISRIDNFFRRHSPISSDAGDCKSRDGEQVDVDAADGDDGTVPMQHLQLLLLDKFRTLWTFQRRRLLDSDTARMALFLNPSNLCRNGEEGGKEMMDELRWEETAEMVRSMISQAYDGQQQEKEEDDDNAADRQEEEIRAEVNNYVKVACEELGRASVVLLPAACDDGGGERRLGTSADSPNGDEPVAANSPSPQPFASLAELLFWWCVNADRFPRLVQFARQYCAIPLCMEDDADWRKSITSNKSSSTNSKSAQYAAELMAKEGDIAQMETARVDRLNLLTQMMTARMAVIGGGESGANNGGGPTTSAQC